MQAGQLSTQTTTREVLGYNSGSQSCDNLYLKQEVIGRGSRWWRGLGFRESVVVRDHRLGNLVS